MYWCKTYLDIRRTDTPLASHQNEVALLSQVAIKLCICQTFSMLIDAWQSGEAPHYWSLSILSIITELTLL